MPKHLISTNDLSINDINEILDEAISYKNAIPNNTLENKLITTIFFENSTRTLSSFEIAVKRLGGKVVRLDISKSSTLKGETIADTAANINAMNTDAIIIRHQSAGAGNYLAKYVTCPIINGGDGAHAHPTQALLDTLTMKLHFKNLEGKKIAIVGDIVNSRVATSGIDIFSRLGMEVILVAPPHFQSISNKLRQTTNIKEIIDEVDVIMSLRTQTERHNNQIYGSLKDYASRYCITKDLIGNRNIIILHPGPVHRNIDIDDEMLKDSRCKVLSQVSNGVYIRMAILNRLINQ
ncbi:aspartate carbamoyltransferase catalytic subunit [Helicobacter sp. MIT 14-3879]|uniref:aspartate carbamoyltransferase catalytic subunit n=1 Tax=Helicobacter sp. MIT 14-3879 TaxID=2040649 RepID=UPI000E1EBD70|nr:aspartate carbamoyltransferase catalytic subunit [Helicobacter sp. MIT 14-3879]RDU62656.1 aspartate carbamoyltransferase [Helicobacter sp. MIT 14-3879]